MWLPVLCMDALLELSSASLGSTELWLGSASNLSSALVAAWVFGIGTPVMEVSLSCTPARKSFHHYLHLIHPLLQAKQGPWRNQIKGVWGDWYS